MANEIDRAEETAVHAAQAMIRVVNFGDSVLEALTKAVAEVPESPLRPGSRVRLSTQDARLIGRYATPANLGETRIQRYLYSLFSLTAGSAPQSKNIYPFLLVSLVNAEGRPPLLVYGLIEKLEGREEKAKYFCEYFLL